MTTTALWGPAVLMKYTTVTPVVESNTFNCQTSWPWGLHPQPPGAILRYEQIQGNR